LEDIAFNSKSGINNCTSIEGGVPVFSDIGIEPCYCVRHIPNDSNLFHVGEDRIGNGKRVGIIKRNLAICSNDNTVFVPNNNENCAVFDNLCLADTNKEEKQEKHLFHINKYSIYYYPTWQGGMIDRNLKGWTISDAEIVDIDVSEDGKLWYHLVGSPPCCNGFRSLEIISTDKN
jgi:hypothetical protein